MILPNVTVLPAAEKFIRRMVRFSDHPTGGMRLTVTPGGCSGYSSEFTIEPAPRAGDAEISLAGTRVFLPAESRLVLDGIVVDFVDSPTKSGLTFTNPGQAPCACSSSGDASAMPAESGVTLDSIRSIVRG